MKDHNYLSTLLYLRFKFTYDSEKQRDSIQERITVLLAAVWELAPIPTDLDTDLTSFGCWNPERGPINKILATLTHILRNRAKTRRLPQNVVTRSGMFCSICIHL